MKCNRVLKKYFPTQESLSVALLAETPPDKRGTVSAEQLKDFLLRHFRDEITAQRVRKSDVEGFLSAFSYNKYGMTQLSAVPDLVFGDPAAHTEHFHKLQRGMPPPEHVNAALKDFEPEGEGEIHTRGAKALMDKLVEKCFTVPKKMYDIFKSFDFDDDGKQAQRADPLSSCRLRLVPGL